MFNDLKETHIKFVHPEFNDGVRTTEKKDKGDGHNIAAMIDHTSGQKYFRIQEKLDFQTSPVLNNTSYPKTTKNSND